MTNHEKKSKSNINSKRKNKTITYIKSKTVKIIDFNANTSKNSN